MRTCFQCGKLGHFVTDCSEMAENRDNYKHKLKTDGNVTSLMFNCANDIT
jgi:hypothetical protein